MSGSGTLADPYIIYDVDDLQAMKNDLNAYYELANDIDASATSGWNGGAGFLPIGQAANFIGSFDGKGYTISDITINRPATHFIGLFAQIENAALRDFNLDGGVIIGRNFTGAIAGRVWDSTIENCHSTIDITGGSHDIGGLFGNIAFSITASSIHNCSCTGNVTAQTIASNYNLGGFVGYCYGITISTSCATGNIYSADRLGLIGGAAGGGGGFVGGSSSSRLNDCYAKGSISAAGETRRSGGFCGNSDSSINNCYSIGAVSGTTDIGGFLGRDSGGSFTGCFWDINTSGQATSAGGTGKTTAQMKTKSTFTNAGWDLNIIWGMLTSGIIDYPCLLDVTPSCSNIILASVSTESANNINQSQATLNSILTDDGGELCDCYFEWGLTDAYGNTTPTESKTTGEILSQVISSLDPDTLYHFRAFATNGAGTAYGDDKTFVTESPALTEHSLVQQELLELLRI